MAKVLTGLKPVGTLVAAASSAVVPTGDGALAQGGGLPPGTTVSVEGGVAFSDYWSTTFPGNPVSLLPPITDPDKTGLPPTSSGSLQSRDNTGGYGSFSLGRTINPALDWRFSVAAFDFGTTRSAADASQDVSGFLFFFTNTASVAETNQFALVHADFDFGKIWTQGAAQFRAFAGLRALHTFDRFQRTITTEATDKVGFLTLLTTGTNELSNGSSHFTGVGPRIGMDVFVGSTWGLVGSVSGALIGGVRNSDFSQTTTVSLDGVPVLVTHTPLSDNRADWVANLSGMIGGAWQFSPVGQVVIGYRVDQWFNIRDDFGFAGFNNKQDVLVHTPFAKVVVRY
jgi:hypothetical protein